MEGKNFYNKSKPAVQKEKAPHEARQINSGPIIYRWANISAHLDMNGTKITVEISGFL